MGYITIGVKNKFRAVQLKRNAIKKGYKGVKIIPYVSYGNKRPSHYDITYTNYVEPIKIKKSINHKAAGNKAVRKLQKKGRKLGFDF